MIDLETMASGLAMLSVAFGREITPQLAEVYHGVLSRLSPEEWERAVRRALEAESFFPPPAVLLGYGRNEGAPKARAAYIYELILRHFECGHKLGPREVGEKYGVAAMDAFVAAGSVAAFAWCEPDSQPFRLKAFVEAWIETAAQDPVTALPPTATREFLQ